jgi:O-acetyl-ADP-ribose deacetylase (regulator of RNase III)
MNNIIVINGDLTTIKADIYVTAANTYLIGGGGIDGVIHHKAGVKLLEECSALNGCSDGEAKITNGYNLLCDKVIHTVGPHYIDGKHDEDKTLRSCYLNCMKVAEVYRSDNNLKHITIAFPCISTGVFKFPKNTAVSIAVKTIKEIDNKNITVIFTCYEVSDYQLYIKEVYDIDIMYLMS